MDKNIESILSSVMANEDLMNRVKEIVKNNNKDVSASLSDVVSAIAPEINESKNVTEAIEKINDTNENTNENTNNYQNDGMGSIISSFNHSISKNAPLLSALKPYLSKERCQIIENIVKISQIADVLKLI